MSKLFFFLPNIKDFQLEEILAVVFIPVILSIVTSQLEDFIEPLEWRHRLIKVGWDNGVLALGVMGAVLCEHPEPTGVLAGVGSIGLILSLTMVIGRFRKKAIYTGWRAILSMSIGASALMIPTAWIIKYVTGGVHP